ncbi:tetratricopeptide repeat protein [Candidatus Bathyarchaeota archaeon]|nr:tetratricopeptide repeat protein [Candidatus Bathyarchaeota archaeon]
MRKFIIKALVSFGDKSVVDPIINAFTDESHFLDRDFIKVLWIFPEYKGKELWEIIEMRKRESLEELQVPESGLDDSIEEQSMVREAFQYELAVNEGKCKIPGSEPVPAKPGKEPRVQPRDCDDETVMLEESKARAKQEMVPGSREKEIQMIKRDLLHDFSKFFNKGERAYRKKLYYEAVTNFKKALEIKYDAWQAWYNMALVFYDIEEPEKSMECFKKSLKFKPNEVDTLINIASLYRENGKYHAAIKFFLRALELDKYQTDVWLVLGKIFKKLKIFKFSLYCLDQVLKLSKSKKERKETRKMYEIMVEAHPEVKPTNPLEEEMPRMPEEDLKLKLD